MARRLFRWHIPRPNGTWGPGMVLSKGRALAHPASRSRKLDQELYDLNEPRMALGPWLQAIELPGSYLARGACCVIGQSLGWSLLRLPELLVSDHHTVVDLLHESNDVPILMDSRTTSIMST